MSFPKRNGSNRSRGKKPAFRSELRRVDGGDGAPIFKFVTVPVVDEAHAVVRRPRRGASSKGTADAHDWKQVSFL